MNKDTSTNCPNSVVESNRILVDGEWKEVKQRTDGYIIFKDGTITTTSKLKIVWEIDERMDKCGGESYTEFEFALVQVDDEGRKKNKVAPNHLRVVIFDNNCGIVPTKHNIEKMKLLMLKIKNIFNSESISFEHTPSFCK